MIRRLQPEPPKVDTSAQKTDPTKDSTDQESLALEFKKLLDKARGGVDGAQNEVVALGLALAQAVSTAQVQRKEIKKGANLGDSQVVSDAKVEDDVRSDDFASCAVGREVKVEAKTSKNGPEKSDVEGEEEQFDGEVVVDDAGDETLDQGGDQISLDDEVVFTEVDDVLQQASVDVVGPEVTAVETQVAALVAQSQARATVQEGPVESQELVTQHSKKDRGARTSEEEVDEELYLDDDEQTLSSFQDPSALKGQSKRLVESRVKGAEDSAANPEQVYDSAENQVSTSSDGAQGDKSQDTAFANGFSEVVKNPREGDATQRAHKQEGSPVTQNGPEMWGAPSVSRERNNELSLQVTLLRQAYDSLRAQTQVNSDARPKATSSTVSGVGASAEPRATEHDTAPRQAKYLNRATQQRMLERVESALKEAARSRDGKTISLKLEPVNLGQVKVDVSLRDGSLHARVVPQNPEVVQALRDHSHELQGALRRLGLNVEKVTVQVTADAFQQTMTESKGFFDGKSFQQDGNNMPGKGRQTPEHTFGNEIADVAQTGSTEAGIAMADHWIA